MGQEYLPNRLGIASGVTLGLSIGLGGVGAAVLGQVADAYGLRTALEVVALLPLPALLLAMSLPEGRRATSAAVAPRATDPAPATTA
jgi:FSR family fosmidomycin resistance protein-like MFS transporter